MSHCHKSCNCSSGFWSGFFVVLAVILAAKAFNATHKLGIEEGRKQVMNVTEVAKAR
jgi:hypothetical protein